MFREILDEAYEKYFGREINRETVNEIKQYIIDKLSPCILKREICFFLYLYGERFEITPHNLYTALISLDIWVRYSEIANKKEYIVPINSDSKWSGNIIRVENGKLEIEKINNSWLLNIKKDSLLDKLI